MKRADRVSRQFCEKFTIEYKANKSDSEWVKYDDGAEIETGVTDSNNPNQLFEY